ncbi:hypothetical protein DIPPA_26013 [Diplonema papillatum]|nr:hypothetical protein DIPPA_26013 [Diplonema papillatum]
MGRSWFEVNLLDPRLSTFGSIVQFLDWAGYTFVTWEFFALIVAAVLTITWVALSPLFRRPAAAAEPGEVALRGGAPPQRARPTTAVRAICEAPVHELPADEARSLLERGTAAVAAGDDATALQHFEMIVRHGAGLVMTDDVFVRALHEAAVVHRRLGQPDKAVALIQIEKFYYENVVVDYASNSLTAAARGKLSESIPDALRADATASVSRKQCKHFCQLARMFLGKADYLMALDYAIKAFALRQKIDGRNVQNFAQNGLQGIRKALSESVGETEEHTVLLKCYNAATVGQFRDMNL